MNELERAGWVLKSVGALGFVAAVALAIWKGLSALSLPLAGSILAATWVCLCAVVAGQIMIDGEIDNESGAEI